MSVSIRLTRGGAKKKPIYTVVAVDSRKKRDTLFLDRLGHYNPHKNPAEISIDMEKLNSWIANGAICSDTVASLAKKVRKGL